MTARGESDIAFRRMLWRIIECSARHPEPAAEMKSCEVHPAERETRGYAKFDREGGLWHGKIYLLDGTELNVYGAGYSLQDAVARLWLDCCEKYGVN